MSFTLQTMEILKEMLQGLDGRAYSDYQQLKSASFRFDDRVLLKLIHIQNSKGAYPASVCCLRMAQDFFGFHQTDMDHHVRRMAAFDMLLRCFSGAVKDIALQNRGDNGSGSFQPIAMPQQVLERNIICVADTSIEIMFRISLPGDKRNRILGWQAEIMLLDELPRIIQHIKAAMQSPNILKHHCDTVEDMRAVQDQLDQLGLIGFVAEGSILPRASGISDLPLHTDVTPFRVPDNLAVELNFPHAGRIRGLAIPKGVTVLIGGGFHGKSTLLNALNQGIEPHIPGDGREQVITNKNALSISAEQGRSVCGVDISAFMDALPDQADTAHFSTRNASGSTSQAANVVESILAGAKLLLIDEDSSANNFLSRDALMRQLLPEDPITPLCDHIRTLYEHHGVSSIIVTGGSSSYLSVADQVIAMRHYQPESMTDAVHRLALHKPYIARRSIPLQDQRTIETDNFDPTYHSERHGTIPMRIKISRGNRRVIEYGDDVIDLSGCVALADHDQTWVIAQALLLARHIILHTEQEFSPTTLAVYLIKKMHNKGLDVLSSQQDTPHFFAMPRTLELVAAINRLRSLHING